MDAAQRRSLRKKNAIYTAVLLLAVILVYQFRKYNETPKQEETPPNPSLVLLTGRTMGVVDYHIKYLDPQKRSFKAQIDSILKDFNRSLSTYIPSSEISQFNQHDSVSFKLPYFYPVLQRSKEIYELTDGAFDPTIMPLVRAWGFKAKQAPETLPTEQVQNLLQLVDFESITFDEVGASKGKSGVSLDFGAIAKGYAVDVVGAFLQKNDIQNYMVEIGGEVLCSGKNGQNELWVLGIKDPQAAEQQETKIQSVIRLDNQAMATSGNYYNFYIKDGKKYAHTLNPKTGYPVEHSLLSATVIAKDCMSADAYATAFMVLGLEKSKMLLEKLKNQNIKVYFLYEEKGEMKTFSNHQEL